MTISTPQAIETLDTVKDILVLISRGLEQMLIFVSCVVVVAWICLQIIRWWEICRDL